MTVSFNSNIKLLMGGSFCGGTEWNKSTNDIDKCFKLYFLRSGNAIIEGQKDSFTLDGPNLYFINGYVIQSQKCTEKMVVDWIHFKPESVYFNYLLQFSQCVQPLDPDKFQTFKPIFKKLNSFFLNRLTDSEERIIKLEIQSLIQFANAQVFKLLDKHLFQKDSTVLRLLPALEYINVHYRKDINLKQIADVCFLSPNYFHRLFKQNFNTSPLNYIRQIRMEEAIRQLVYTNKTVKEIAYDTGYEDEAYFSRTFSKIYGTSPGRYRKLNNKKLP